MPTVSTALTSAGPSAGGPQVLPHCAYIPERSGKHEGADCRRLGQHRSGDPSWDPRSRLRRRRPRRILKRVRAGRRRIRGSGGRGRRCPACRLEALPGGRPGVAVGTQGADLRLETDGLGPGCWRPGGLLSLDQQAHTGQFSGGLQGFVPEPGQTSGALAGKAKQGTRRGPGSRALFAYPGGPRGPARLAPRTTWSGSAGPRRCGTCRGSSQVGRLPLW